MFELKRKSIPPSTNNNTDTTTSPLRTRKFALLACENNPPYGPPQHTANLFLELFHQTALYAKLSVEFQMDVYNVMEGEYPNTEEEWDQYDGFVLPGSFAAAYDTDPWILTLQKQIQRHIVVPERPTLAVCFGHQIMAQSFAPQGQACKMIQARAGRYEVLLSIPPTTTVSTSTNSSTTLSPLPTHLLSQFFSHGDMVKRLPDTAVVWGSTTSTSSTGSTGNDVPIQMAAYYGTKLYCISFQAHPEYSTEIQPLLGTLIGCMDAMKTKHTISIEDYQKQLQDAYESHEQVRETNLIMMIYTFQTLGWF